MLGGSAPSQTIENTHRLLLTAGQLEEIANQMRHHSSNIVGKRYRTETVPPTNEGSERDTEVESEESGSSSKRRMTRKLAYEIGQRSLIVKLTYPNGEESGLLASPPRSAPLSEEITALPVPPPLPLRPSTNSLAASSPPQNQFSVPESLPISDRGIEFPQVQQPPPLHRQEEGQSSTAHRDIPEPVAPVDKEVITNTTVTEPDLHNIPAQPPSTDPAPPNSSIPLELLPPTQPKKLFPRRASLKTSELPSETSRTEQKQAHAPQTATQSEPEIRSPGSSTMQISVFQPEEGINYNVANTKEGERWVCIRCKASLVPSKKNFRRHWNRQVCSLTGSYQLQNELELTAINSEQNN